jgi:hypothetical protein
MKYINNGYQTFNSFEKTERVRWLFLFLKLAPNGSRLGEGGLVGCSILAECFCPLLPNPCYV